MVLLGLAAATAGVSWALCAALLPILRARAILDHPNARSSHARPTPRGGGIAVIGAVVVVWVAIAALGAAEFPAILLIGAAGLALVSWFDDLKGLGPAPRLAAQLVAVGGAWLVLAPAGPVFQGWLPPVLDTVAALVLWMWFINLFNFMDGIDGIAGVETLCIGAGVGLVGAISGAGGVALAAILAGAAAGFLPWNWQPAKLFLGDVGSIPLGFLLGWLLLDLAADGRWAAALILPAYYLADATITLVRRASRGARPWRAHREHFYQRAVRGGCSHRRATTAVAAADLGLIGCAVAAALGALPQVAALISSVVLVAGLMWYFDRAAKSAPPGS
ncbi:MAG: glycosyl transferase [Alphaproteobacteria bacterium]|jgi:UDP-N-acetylmuramyl pentapeptide phosphotransferase/UDP-N-acetylglucosamine-1-phosphate transferase|nr:glycosyl transferase [Alphaproteobacteria bacterium]